MYSEIHSNDKFNDEIKKLKSIIKENEKRIENLQNALVDSQKLILEIHQSLPAQLFNKYDNSIGKLLPLRLKQRILKDKKHVQIQKSIVSSISATKKDILCFPIIDWNYRTQRPHHLLREFVKNGHRVFYFTTTFRKLNKPYSLEILEDGIIQVEFSFDRFFDIYKDKFKKSNLKQFLDNFKSFQKEFDIDAISFVMFPTWVTLVLNLKKLYGYKIIFDCLDDISGFPNLNKKRINEEKILIKNADLVIASSSILFKKINSITKSVKLIPNGGDFEHFQKANSEKILKDIPQPIIGYFGTISEWFDVNLVEFLASKIKNASFVFIGYTYGSNLRKLMKFDNVHFLGEMPYSELPAYLEKFSVCIIPFKLTSLIKSTHPIKIYEYFSQGKPVVSTKIPDLVSIKDICYIAENKEDFLGKLNSALKEENKTLKNKRILYAKENTWIQRFNGLYDSINQIPSIDMNFHEKIK